MRAPTKNKSWSIALILLFVAAGLTLLLRNTDQKEPTYKGLPLSRWIAVTSGTSDLNKGLAEIGPQSIPYLCRALRTRSNPVQSSWCWMWRHLPAAIRIKFLSHAPIEARAIRQNALWGLRFWGPEASEALPDLTELALFEGDLMNRTLLYHATVEVGGNPSVALAEVHTWLTNQDAIVRSHVVGAILDSPIHDSTTLGLLIDNAKRSPTPAYAELLAFGAIGPDAAAALPVVTKALTNSVTRNNALTALAGLGASAVAALPLLMELIERGELQLTPQVLEIIIHIGPAARIAEPKLRGALESQDAVVRVLAAVGLGRMNNDPAVAVPVLIAELHDQQYRKEQHWNVWLPQTHIIGLDHRQTAAWFLGEIGPSARSALPELEEAMRSNQTWLNVFAARAIWKISGESSQSVLALANAVQDKDELACVLAARALAEVGPAAKLALPAMLSARTNSLYVRRAINAALETIDEPTARRTIYQPSQ